MVDANGRSDECVVRLTMEDIIFSSSANVTMSKRCLVLQTNESREQSVTSSVTITHCVFRRVYLSLFVYVKICES